MGVPLNIDWQQILLHLFNFLILFGGLYLLLYRPVKAFMDKRTAYYADMDAEAKRKLADAERQEKQYQTHLHNIWTIGICHPGIDDCRHDKRDNQFK